MAKAYGVMALWLLGPVLAAAQIPEVAETVVPAPHGSYRMTQVENRGAISMVAIHVLYLCPSGRTMGQEQPISLDALITPNSRSMPLAQGKTVTFGIPQSDGTECTGGVDGVLFADGRAKGSPAAIDALYARRRGTYRGLQVALKQVRRVAHEGADPQAVSAELTNEMHASQRAINIDIEERMGEEFVLSVAAQIMKSKFDTWIPADKGQPNTERLGAEQKIPWAQAHGLVLERQLGEWSAGLGDHLQLVGDKAAEK